jgi:hypothetical protein
MRNCEEFATNIRGSNERFCPEIFLEELREAV